MFENRLYFNAFEKLKDGEEFNKEAWQIEKIQLIQHGFIQPADTDSFTELPLRCTLTGPNGEWQGVF